MIKISQVPLWNPYFFCGQPLFAALQPGILYPFNFLLLLLPFDYTFNMIIILHFLLAGYLTYLFLKTLQTSDTAALIGGMTFMLSGYLLSVHNLLNHLLSVIWLPLVLLNFHRYLEKQKKKYLIYITIFLTVMFFGGGIEILYGTFLLLFILVFFPDPFGIGIVPPPMKKRCAGLLVIAFLFFCLSAVQLIPFLEMTFHSTRAGGLSYKEAVTWSLELKDLIQFFLPDLYGYTHSTQKYWQNQSWLKTIYLGVIPFIFFLFFLIEKKRKALPLILIIEVSLLLAFGGNTLVYRFLFLYMPFLNTIRYPVKFLFIFIFFLSIGAGMGYDSLCQQIRNQNRITRRIIQGILVFSVCSVCVWSLMNFHQRPVQAFMEAKGIAPPDYNFLLINIHNIKRFLLFCSLLGPVMAFGWHYIQKHRIFSLILVALLMVDLFFANQGFYSKYDTKKYNEPSETIRFIKEDLSLFRVAVEPKTQKDAIKYTETFSDPIRLDKEKITPGFNLEYRIYSIHGAEVIRLGNYEKIHSLIMSAPRPDSTNLLGLLNVKYIISKHEMDSKELELVEIVGDKEDPEASLRVYKNLYCLPRAFLVENYQVLHSEEAYKEVLQSKTFDPSQLILLDETPFWEGSGFGKGENSEIGRNTSWDLDEKEGVTISNYQPNRIELSAFLKQPKLLFLSEIYYPGWKVYIDGEKGRILRADFAFRVVPLTPGFHRVTLVYEPLSVILGAVVTLFTIGLIFLLGIRYHLPDKILGHKRRYK